MLTLISPAKTLDLDSPLPTRVHTGPELLAEAGELAAIMKRKSPAEIAALLGISDELAALNATRYAEWGPPFDASNARPALLTFAGDVYVGLDAARRFTTRDFTDAQKTLRILSGLYGLLRPLDLIQPYRLEMGTALATERGATLVAWWGDRITKAVRAALDASPGPRVLVNLASAEYSAAVDTGALGATVISPRFEDRTPKGEWKVISFPAKRARGMMAGWLVTSRARTAKAVRDFDEGGYRYQPALSTPAVPVYRREGSR